MLANLGAAGVAPTDIEAVLLTHMHPDHSAGLTDMETGKLNYPNAELVVHENEPRHWFDDAKMASATERAKSSIFRPHASRPRPTRSARAYSQRARSFPA